MRDIFSTSPEAPSERSAEERGWAAKNEPREGRGVLNSALGKVKTAEALPETKSPRHYKPPLYVPSSRVSSGSNGAVEANPVRQRVVYPGGHRKLAKSTASDTSRSVASTAQSSPQKKSPAKKLLQPELQKTSATPAKEPNQFDTLTRARLDALVNELDMIHGGNEEPPSRPRNGVSQGKQRKPPNYSARFAYVPNSSTMPNLLHTLDLLIHLPLRYRFRRRGPAARFLSVSCASRNQLRRRGRGARAYVHHPRPKRSAEFFSDLGFVCGEHGVKRREEGLYFWYVHTLQSGWMKLMCGDTAKDYQAHREPSWPSNEPPALDEFGFERPPANLRSAYVAGDRSKDWLGADSGRAWEDSHADRWSIGDNDFSPVLPSRGGDARTRDEERREDSTRDNLNVILESLSEFWLKMMTKIGLG